MTDFSKRDDEQGGAAPPYATTTDDVGRRRGLHPARHIASFVLCLLLVPVATAFLDYAGFRSLLTRAMLPNPDALELRVLVCVLIGAGLLFLAAANSRLSAFGPLVAGLLYGVLPTLLSLYKPTWLSDLVDRAPDLYDNLGNGVMSAPLVYFPALGALLLGAAVGGRWGGRRG